MGYTVATPIKNERLRDQIVAFLDEHWRTWPQLHGKPRDAPMYISLPHPDGKGRYEPKTARNLDYDSGKCRIGFNFNAADYERDYAFTACKWIAVRWGKVKKFGFYSVPLPYYVYDGDEPSPIFVKGLTSPDSKLVGSWHLHDKWGCRFMDQRDRIWEKMTHDKPWSFKKEFALIRAEMQRLDHEWKKATGKEPRIWSSSGGVESRA